MQIGLKQLIGGFVAVILLIGGAFAAGSMWDTEPKREAASSADSFESEPSVEKISEDAPAEAPLYPVVRTVDGDTIVANINGKNESIRMIGVDTPELNDSRVGVQCFAKEASEMTKSLVIGKNIRLEMDPSQGDRDKYKRLLAYVFNEDGVFVNKTLIAEGFAHEYTYDEEYKYQKPFKAAEVAAREGGKGLWSPDACPEVPAKRSSKNPAPKEEASPQTASAISAVPVVPAPETTPEPQNPPPVQQPAPHIEMQPSQAPPSEEPPPPEPSFDASSYTCSANTYNCSDFKTQKDAQAVYDKCGGVSKDVHRLDNNKDGSACDSLP